MPKLFRSWNGYYCQRVETSTAAAGALCLGRRGGAVPSVKRRYLLELARRGIAGAYALGPGANGESGCFDSRSSPPLLTK